MGSQQTTLTSEPFRVTGCPSVSRWMTEGFDVGELRSITSRRLIDCVGRLSAAHRFSSSTPTACSTGQSRTAHVDVATLRGHVASSALLLRRPPTDPHPTLSSERTAYELLVVTHG